MHFFIKTVISTIHMICDAEYYNFSKIRPYVCYKIMCWTIYMYVSYTVNRTYKKIIFLCRGNIRILRYCEVLACLFRKRGKYNKKIQFKCWHCKKYNSSVNISSTPRQGFVTCSVYHAQWHPRIIIASFHLSSFRSESLSERVYTINKIIIKIS